MDEKNGADRIMTKEEKAAIIGYHRSGATNETIAFIMGISERYVHIILKEYFEDKLI